MTAARYVWGLLGLAIATAIGVVARDNPAVITIAVPGVAFTAPLAWLIAGSAVAGGLVSLAVGAFPDASRARTPRLVLGALAIAAITAVAVSNSQEVEFHVPMVGSFVQPVAAWSGLAVIGGGVALAMLLAATRRRIAASDGVATIVPTAATPATTPARVDPPTPAPVDATLATTSGATTSAAMAATPAPVDATGSSRARGFGRTDPGRERTSNEDTLVVDDDLGLYIVCDGMGGHAAGEVASGIAASTTDRHMRGVRAAIDAVRQGEAASSTLCAHLEAAVVEASAAVLAAAKTRPEWHKMGCTVTCVLVAGPGEAVFAHVGDTRLYRVRDAQVEQLSRDHSLGAELAAAGAISEREGHEGPLAHALTRCVGHSASLEVDTQVVAAEPGDLFVLCSDGLSDYLDPRADPTELRDLFTGEPRTLPDKLVAYALRSGGHDNVTVVVVRVA